MSMSNYEERFVFPCDIPLKDFEQIEKDLWKDRIKHREKMDRENAKVMRKKAEALAAKGLKFHYTKEEAAYVKFYSNDSNFPNRDYTLDGEANPTSLAPTGKTESDKP